MSRSASCAARTSRGISGPSFTSLSTMFLSRYIVIRQFCFYKKPARRYHSDRQFQRSQSGVEGHKPPAFSSSNFAFRTIAAKGKALSSSCLPSSRPVEAPGRDPPFDGVLRYAEFRRVRRAMEKAKRSGGKNSRFFCEPFRLLRGSEITGSPHRVARTLTHPNHSFAELGTAVT